MRRVCRGEGVAKVEGMPGSPPQRAPSTLVLCGHHRPHRLSKVVADLRRPVGAVEGKEIVHLFGKERPAKRAATESFDEGARAVVLGAGARSSRRTRQKDSEKGKDTSGGEGEKAESPKNQM